MFGACGIPSRLQHHLDFLGADGFPECFFGFLVVRGRHLALATAIIGEVDVGVGVGVSLGAAFVGGAVLTGIRVGRSGPGAAIALLQFRHLTGLN